MGVHVSEAWARCAAAKLDLESECVRIANDEVPPGAYTANSHSELLKLPSDERCRLLASFNSNSTITSLELSHTGIDVPAARVLASLLSGRNTALTALNIERNHISSEGIVLLSLMLAKNSTLRVLKLAYQQVTISSAAELQIAEQLERNTTLLKLTIDLRQA
ncbi:hypothetical protein T492DRAFT_482782 [Pavlovales sp. CCMP2436]|nr:hypothetical protein T492DRAFT_482782 [Pavlovales sp. CCMP2436]